MAHTLAAVAVSLFLPIPQGTEEASQKTAEPILSSSEISSLNRKLTEWNEAWLDYDVRATSARERRRAAKQLSSAKEDFLKDWDSKMRKGDLLASMPDLRQICANSFEYERQSVSGNIKMVKEESEIAPAHAFIAPRSYDPRTPYPAVVLVPGWDQAREDWAPLQEWFDKTWAGTEAPESTIFIMPQLDKGLDLDTAPDAQAADRDQIEGNQLRAVLGSSGTVQRSMNLDRERLYLDCGAGSCVYAVRLASFFPDRFAGLVLRKPTEVPKDLRLGSLAGLPVLMLTDDSTKEAAEALKSRLEKAGSDAVTIVEGEGEYPFTASGPKVAEWAAGTRRRLTPQRVVIEPNSDRFNGAYWAEIGVAEPLANLPDDQKPRLAVESDRENNRITVDARAIGDFTLLLNDDIIDLDKPFTVVVNGTALKEERERSLTAMVRRIQGRYDPSWVFVTDFATTVPSAGATTGN